MGRPNELMSDFGKVLETPQIVFPFLLSFIFLFPLSFNFRLFFSFSPIFIFCFFLPNFSIFFLKCYQKLCQLGPGDMSKALGVYGSVEDHWIG